MLTDVALIMQRVIINSCCRQANRGVRAAAGSLLFDSSPFRTGKLESEHFRGLNSEYLYTAASIFHD